MSEQVKLLKAQISKLVELECQNFIDRVVMVMSKQFDIDRQQLKTALEEFENEIDQRRKSTCLDYSKIQEDKCLGKTKTNTQCSRSRQKDGLFCGSHCNRLPYGRVDDHNNDRSNKKRGRPRKGGGQSPSQPTADNATEVAKISPTEGALENQFPIISSGDDLAQVTVEALPNIIS